MKKIIALTFVSLLIFISCGDDINLPELNSKNLPQSDSLVVTIKRGESFLINNELKIAFDSVPTDSRCPINAMCVWAGDGEVKLLLTKNNNTVSASLHTTLTPKSILFDNYEIQLVDLFPARVAGEQILQDQYSAKLKIKLINAIKPKPIYIIDQTTEGIIHKDYLGVSNVFIDNNILTLSAAYSGGCKEHYINLYAYSGIMKSNPAQMALVVSHNGNGDMCEAYMSGQVKFDLKNLREYLGGFGIKDKIILNITDPDGVPLNQSPITYVIK